MVLAPLGNTKCVSYVHIYGLFVSRASKPVKDSVLREIQGYLAPKKDPAL